MVARDEVEQIRRWRRTELVRLGFTPRQAHSLSDTTDVVHLANELIGNGCPPALAARILRGPKKEARR